MTEAVFTNGTYHRNFDESLARADRGYDITHHTSNLDRNYRFSFNLIKQRGWKDPLSGDSPRVLLIGTATDSTASTFVNFVKWRNPSTKISIADLSSYPLERCIANGLDKLPNVTFHQTDIRAILDTFPPNSFDLIETDGLLQFLSPENKAKALQQVFAALKPGGVFTTRDRFVSEDVDELTDREYRRWQEDLEYRLEARPYHATKESMWELLGEIGFSRTMVRRDTYRSLKFVNHIIAKKPEEK